METSGSKGLQKIVILGAQAVGKTCVMQRFVNKVFTYSYKATIGADFASKEVSVGDDVISLQLWDTAGQERFHSLGHPFFRGADACVLVYDVTNAASFSALETWYEQFVRLGNIANPRDFPFVVMGNKCDLDPSRHVVRDDMVKDWCARHGGIPDFKVSALNGDHVDEAFMTVVKAAASRSRESEPVLPDKLKLDIKPAPRNDCAC